MIFKHLSALWDIAGIPRTPRADVLVLLIVSQNKMNKGDGWMFWTVGGL